jgi:hypothetical protein
MKTVQNERLKISATFLNGIAIAILAIGGLSPAVQATRGYTSGRGMDPHHSRRRHLPLCGRHTTFRCKGDARRAQGMTIETVALLITPVGGLILGLVVFLVARRAARRDLDTSNPKPVPHTRH